MKRGRVILLGVLVAALVAPAAATGAELPEDPDYVPYEPGLSDEERGMLRLINDARRAAGLAALPNAVTLTVPADKYANYLVATDQFDHNLIGSPGDRAEDAGWPVVDADAFVYENLGSVPGGSGPDMFSAWMDSPGHRTNFMAAAANAIGLGHRADLWIAMIGRCPGGVAPDPACQLTSDYGDPLPPPGSGPGQDPPAAPDPPRADPPSLRKAKAKGKRVRLTFELPAGSSGLVLEASRKRKRVVRELAGSGTVKTVLRLGKGWWRLEAESGSTAACDRIKVKVPRKRADAKRRWKKVKVRAC